MKTFNIQNIDEFNEYLSPNRTVEFDSGCGEPIAWGSFVTKTMPEEKWAKFRISYEVRCHMGMPSQWYVVTEELTRQDAIVKYGPVTDELYGPRGGFKWVNFGRKRFYSNYLQCNNAKAEFKLKSKRS